MGEFLTNAQGEDVVAGVRTPMPISQMEEKFPQAYADFVKVCDLLEDHYRDMQDMEFTVENGKLYMLQCRSGKRTAQAALKIACDLVDEGMIDEKKAVSMIDPRNLDTLLHPQFDAAVLKKAPAIAKALPASPGAALTADEIAKEADFFSFGTNDLTQMTFGFSRDDAGKFLGAYYDKKIYESDPFARLDQAGVGKLVSMAAKMGRETNPHIHLGICGEHGGDPTSVEFCHKVGLDYVSCSPFRVPIARLAAAQAAIKEM